MAYEGELLNQCSVHTFDFRKTYAAIVSGARFNPWGHMLLNTGGKRGHFFQVAEGYGQPRLMDERQFERYLAENGKTIVTVMRVHIPFPQKSYLKLEELLSKQWVWGAVVHNCESLVEEIVMAGGGPKLRHGMFPLPMHAANSCEGW